MRIAIVASSFARYDKKPLELLEQAGIEYILNDTGQPLTEDELIQLIKGCAGIVIGSEQLTRKVLENNPRLKVIACCGKHLDNIDTSYAQSKGIMIYNPPKGYAIAVAEFTLGLILSLIRQVPYQDREVRAGIWRKRIGNLLHGKRVGIIGLGQIGTAVAERILPFGVEIAYNDPNVHSTSYQKFDLDQLIDWANIITIHCSKPEKTGPILDLGRLSLMQPGSYLINVARGGLIDEKALCGLLTAGHLAGAALDVFSKEPYEGVLKEINNVILTPHIGSYAKESRIIIETDAVKSIIKTLKSTSYSTN